MKRIYSKDYPATMRHRGAISVPVSIQEELAMPEIDPGAIGGTAVSPAPHGYSCQRIQIVDTGQDLANPYVVLGLRVSAEHQAINQAYTESLAAGCPIESLGLRVDCKPENCSDFAQSLVIFSMAYADQPTAAVVVRDYSNANHTITFAEYQVLCQELGAHVMRLRQQKWAAVDALTDLEV